MSVYARTNLRYGRRTEGDIPVERSVIEYHDKRVLKNQYSFRTYRAERESRDDPLELVLRDVQLPADGR